MAVTSVAVSPEFVKKICSCRWKDSHGCLICKCRGKCQSVPFPRNQEEDSLSGGALFRQSLSALTNTITL